MNIRLFRLRPLIAELRGIRLELQRANDIREIELAHLHDVHVKPPLADTSGPEPEVVYTDEESDFFRELSEEIGKLGKREEE